MARDIKKIDAKGRFFIPSKHKDKLGGEVVVTNSLDKGYLCVYSKDRFENRIKPEIRDINKLSPAGRKLEKIILLEASEVNVDAQGRIPVISELWERIGAKAGDEICVFNDDDKLLICTKAHYDNEDHDLGDLEGLENLFNVTGL
ncbi:MAG: hypothetical protein IKS75_08900 [Clostridiales bacterium]|nr:hypothetical protein [Clostridiales bacterium]